MINWPYWIFAVGTAAIVVLLEVLVSYRNHAQVLKWLAIALLSYPATALIVHEPWKDILYATFVPHIEFSFAFLFIITGVFGTSISPYMFFWQASEEVEEEVARDLAPDGAGRPRLPKTFIRDMRLDTAIGMVAAEAAQWFIIITTATVLFRHGVTNINTAADAAKALEPLVKSFPNSVSEFEFDATGTLRINSGPERDFGDVGARNTRRTSDVTQPPWIVSMTPKADKMRERRSPIALLPKS